ncbi:hypothetical protein DRE_02400 [Drechslerella stenobrocha 248]|uniref:U4/U6.U5 small nuclear ribonucleoprotein 27kDa protein domain-containing protein n=1 Tax=Drechslerella stenobrocha 248 TaxID=1043628 RepID=W7HVU6_9PEZI|nr:hypothetical protein DRE_02400 [Drechslerella stenobrocha 248]
MDRGGRKRGGPGRYGRDGAGDRDRDRDDRRAPGGGPVGGGTGARYPRDDYYNERRDERYGGTRDSPHYSRRRSPRSRSPADGKSHHNYSQRDSDMRRRRSRSPDGAPRPKWADRDDTRYDRSHRYDRDDDYDSHRSKRSKYRSRSPSHGRRDKSRDRGGRDKRYHNSRSRSRSSSPRGKRHRTRSRSPKRERDRGRTKHREPERDTEMQNTGDGDGDDAMMAIMGFGGFTSTKGKKIEGNAVGGAKIEKQAQYRQYMNRVGGFNRALSPPGDK